MSNRVSQIDVSQVEVVEQRRGDGETERQRDGETSVGSNARHASSSSSSSSSSSVSSEVPPGGWDLQANGQPVEKVNKQRQRRAWAPDAEDRFVYEQVRFNGHSQSEVASMRRLSQATVSRIVQRFERWKAHADPRDDGELDPAERLRAQRWLTYERNEVMLASALRLASQVEGLKQVWKDVTTEPRDGYGSAATKRSENAVIDQTGMVARFLRLGFRINMEQLKLVEKAPPPKPEPLTEEEHGEQESLAAAVRAERQEHEDRIAEDAKVVEQTLMSKLLQAEDTAAAARQEAEAAKREAEAAKRELEALRQEAEELRQRVGDEETRRQGDEETEPGNSGRPEPKVHKMHNCMAGESDVSADGKAGYDADNAAEKNAESCRHSPVKRTETG